MAVAVAVVCGVACDSGGDVKAVEVAVDVEEVRRVWRLVWRGGGGSGISVTCASGIPFSIVARSVFSSRLHFSFDSTITSCWTIIPGPALLCTIFFSFGHEPHEAQRGRCALFLQLRQTTRRLIVADFSLPTYRSSSVTGSSISMFRPRFCSLPPPPPKNMSNGEPPWPSPRSALRTAPMPPWSYTTRFSLSERIS